MRDIRVVWHFCLRLFAFFSCCSRKYSSVRLIMAADRSHEVKRQADFDLSLPCGEQKTHNLPTMKTLIKIPVPSFLIPLILTVACIIGLLPKAQAVSPAPDGCYPGFTTAEGCNALSLLTTGAGNTGLGWHSLFSAGASNYNTGVGAGTLVLNTGDSNTAVGAAAMLLNTTGGQNVAVGTDALVHNDSGDANTATGYFALFSNTTGVANTASGASALQSNTTGNFNTATGGGALSHNTVGVGNTANGFEALLNNDTGSNNTATGSNTLLSNTAGTFNTAIGMNALFSNTTGADNTATGHQALLNNTIGASNTATGSQALSINTTGSSNTATGLGALSGDTTGSQNTAMGDIALSNNSTGGANTALGVGAGGSVTTADNVICIGAGVLGLNVSNTCFINNIRGVATQNADAIPVVIDTNGQLGTASSSRRFKKQIQPMDQASEAILGLTPVTFHYKSDKTSTPQFGLIAEEVAEVNPDLVVRDKNGEIYTVRYDAVNAMLLNEFLKEHRTVQELKSAMAKQEVTIALQQKDLQATAAQQQKQIDALTAGLQKVSAQLELSKAAPKAVLNDQ
jgi:hypothetical protein